MDPVDTRIWPERLICLAREMSGPARARARGEFWLLLNLALAQRLRIQARRLGPFESERVRDLAAEKALDLVTRFDSGHWDPLKWSAGELVNFVSTVARNALVDDLRRGERMVSEPVDALEPRVASGESESAASLVDRREFVSSLLDCAGRLSPRDRTVWLLRVLYDMPSRGIAGHPGVRLKAGHVDVILDRCRRQIRECMIGRGHDLRDLPPGTCSELWGRFRSGPLLPEESND